MPLTPEDHQRVRDLLAPWLFGSVLEIMLQGVVFCQLSHYIVWYGTNDYVYIKLAVTGLAILTTLKSVHSFRLIWVNFIEDFTDLETAITPNWLKTGSPLMVSCICIYVQTYFCYRLYIVSKSYRVVGIIATFMILGFVSIIMATSYMDSGGSLTIKVGQWFAVHLCAVFVGDLLLSLSMIFFLLRKRNDSIPKRTAGLLSRLVWLTFQSALPAAICATSNLISSQLYLGTQKLYSTAFNQVLPKLYAISMLWTINARKEIKISMDLEPSPVTTIPTNDVRVGSTQSRDCGVVLSSGESRVPVAKLSDRWEFLTVPFLDSVGQGRVSHSRSAG